ncbi:DUF5947 family protein [Saccharopolyspora phatthalungensis]|nr:DUF5947 family protein [Saccharopolyspora phatthalungensis]
MTGRTPFAVLRSLARPADESPVAAASGRRVRRPGEACEMCGEGLSERHSHVADLDQRRLLCTCRACYLLFTREGAGAGRRRAVPEDCGSDPDFVLTDQQWEAMQIPVGLAFFFRQSDLGRHVACYPSPGGATESELDLETWDEVVRANPLLRDLRPDVEAALVRRRDGRFECFRTPIDACYELVGIVRRHWVGFHGGEEVWQHIDAYFADLRRRCTRGGDRDGP